MQNILPHLDEFNRWQGLRLHYYYGTNKISFKRYYFNDGLINYEQTFKYNGHIKEEIFHYHLF